MKLGKRLPLYGAIAAAVIFGVVSPASAAEAGVIPIPKTPVGHVIVITPVGEVESDVLGDIDSDVLGEVESEALADTDGHSFKRTRDYDIDSEVTSVKPLGDLGDVLAETDGQSFAVNPVGDYDSVAPNGHSFTVKLAGDYGDSDVDADVDTTPF